MAYDDESPKRNRSQSWWKRRTQMERRIIMFLIIALIVIIALIIAIAVVARKSTKKANHPEEVCLTPGCVKSAAVVLKNMDKSVNPCDDFYQFACGTFVKEAEISADQSEINIYSELRDLVKKQLRVTFEEPEKPNESRPFVLVKNLYNLCMNTTAIESDGLTTVKQLFKSVGGWPVLEGANWNEAAFEWKKALVTFKTNGIVADGFISLGVSFDPHNATRRIITLDQAPLDLGQSNYVQGFSSPMVTAYYEYLVDLTVYFGVERTFAEQEVKAVIDFRTEIAMISLSDEQRRDVVALNNVMKVSELQQRYPSIRWLDFINSLIGLPDKYLTEVDNVNVLVPQYMGAITDVLSRTPKRVQANSLFLQITNPLVKYLPDQIVDRQQQYYGAVYGTSKRAPRFSECIDVLTQGLNLAVGALYGRNYFQEEARQNAIEMVKDIRNAFVKLVKQLDWMDETTKKTAIEKALSMFPHIGYPDEFLDNKKLEDYYAELNLSSGNYLKNMLEIDVFKMNKGLDELKDPINQTDWKTRIAATDINAGYSPQENSIQFPAAFLQGNLFDKDRPQYMNYGAIGFIIGHEVTHGFDDQGKHYDKKGNLFNWWAAETDKAYSDKAKCIVDQYSQQIEPDVGLHVNGENTQGENIADNGGIKEAYLAYEFWVERNGPESALPGLNYTAKQMFWISAANCWCAKMKKAYLEQLITIDVHSPSRFRVLMPFANNDYFSKDFNCPSGSKMNPKHKCQVW